MSDFTSTGEDPDYTIEVGAPKAKRNGTKEDEMRDSSDDADSEIRPSEFSDDTLALRFTDGHLNSLRFVQKWGRWLKWDGKRWSFDETLHVFDLVRDASVANSRAAATIHGFRLNCRAPRRWRQCIDLAQVDQRTAGVVGPVGC